MGGSPRQRKVVLRLLEPVLDEGVASALGVLGGELPPAPPKLDPRTRPEQESAPRLVAVPPLPVHALVCCSGRVEVDQGEEVSNLFGCFPRQLLVADGSGQLVRPRCLCRRLWIARVSAEEGEREERANTKSVVIELVGEPECRARMLARAVEAHSETHGPGEPALDQ